MNRQLSIPEGAEQWLINLIELKNRTDISLKQMAEMENLSEKSVSNVFLGKSKNPGVDLIRRIIHALGGSWREIFGESDAVIGSQDLVTLQAEVDRLTKENRILISLQTEVDRLKTENAMLTSNLNMANLDLSVQKDKVMTLESEIKILRLKLEYEEKLVAVHNFYNKLNTNN
jgi:transcriptional regulator with XRE-family HTH domain